MERLTTLAPSVVSLWSFSSSQCEFRAGHRMEKPMEDRLFKAFKACDLGAHGNLFGVFARPFSPETAFSRPTLYTTLRALRV